MAMANDIRKGARAGIASEDSFAAGATLIFQRMQTMEHTVAPQTLPYGHFIASGSPICHTMEGGHGHGL